MPTKSIAKDLFIGSESRATNYGSDYTDGVRPFFLFHLERSLWPLITVAFVNRGQILVRSL